MARQRVSPTQVKLYQQEQVGVRQTLESMATGYLAGKLTLPAFKSSMEEELKRWYIRVALIAKGQHPFTDKDRKDLQRFLALIYKYLDGFVADLNGYKALASDQGVVSRASAYGVGWGVFSRYSMPADLVDALPDLPGISCMGNGDCGCILEYDNDEDGYNVYWIVSAIKEHCPICLDLAVEWSPYHVPYTDLPEDNLDENGDFIEF